YSATGLMAVFLARIGVVVDRPIRQQVEFELVSYPDRKYGQQIASRLFLPLGYEVEAKDGRLRLRGQKSVGEALKEMPVMLLALDRRSRLFLSADERAEIGRGAGPWVWQHPARIAIEQALEGRTTPLRFVLPPGIEIEREREPGHTALVGKDF